MPRLHDKLIGASLEERRKPNSIAARAVIRSGKGHKYWSVFDESIQTQIQDLAAEINHILFAPRLEKPIKTLDLPVAGKLYSAQTLPLIVDMITIVSNQDNKSDDLDGAATVSVLKDVRRVAYILNSNNASSLGLHPAVYFYSQEGRHKSASFLAVIDFVSRLGARRKLNDFIDVRDQFEEFLLGHDYLVQQINRKHRTAQASHPFISFFFDEVLSALKGGAAVAEVTKQLQGSEKFGYLSMQEPALVRGQPGKKFDTEGKSAVYLREVLQRAPRCAICKGYVHRNSISIDHIERRRDGGSSSVDNGQLSHPYCNTGYKN